MTPVISFVGKHNSGKTTVLEKVVAFLKDSGYRVGIIKHSSHDFEIDIPGKDSYRLEKAGASSIIISSSNKIAMVQKVEQEYTPHELLEILGDVDIIIIEGYKKEDFPKIEVARTGISEELLSVSNRIALVTDFDVDLEGIDKFSFEQTIALSNFIINKFMG